MNTGEIPTNFRSEHLDHIAVWSANWKDSANFLNDFYLKSLTCPERMSGLC